MSIIRKPDVFKTLAGKPYLNFIVSNSNYRQMLNDRTYDEYVAYFAKITALLPPENSPTKSLSHPKPLWLIWKKIQIANWKNKVNML